MPGTGYGIAGVEAGIDAEELIDVDREGVVDSDSSYHSR